VIQLSRIGVYSKSGAISGSCVFLGPSPYLSDKQPCFIMLSVYIRGSRIRRSMNMSSLGNNTKFHSSVIRVPLCSMVNLKMHMHQSIHMNQKVIIDHGPMKVLNLK
jgi:hypothetical protein